MLVKFFATFREITGEMKNESFSASNLEELLHLMGKHYGRKFSETVFVNGKFSPDVIILVNGRAIEHLNGLQTELAGNDQIAVFPRIAGG